MSNEISNYVWVARSNTGLYRKNNEDSLAVSNINFSGTKDRVDISDSSGIFTSDFPGSLFIVADGMGGGINGKDASWLVTREFTSLFKEEVKNFKNVNTDEGKECILTKLEDIMIETHKVLESENIKFKNDPIKVKEFIEKYYKPSTSNISGSVNKVPVMGSTLSSAWISKNDLFLSHVGDSRIYLYSKNDSDYTLEQLTYDHSIVGDLKRKGALNERQARTHPRRSILTQTLGANMAVLNPHVDYTKVKKGSTILICSDGLNDGLWDKNILSSLNFYFKDKKYSDINDIKNNLIELTDMLVASSLRVSGRDNTTVILVHLF